MAAKRKPPPTPQPTSESSSSDSSDEEQEQAAANPTASKSEPTSQIPSESDGSSEEEEEEEEEDEVEAPAKQMNQAEAAPTPDKKKLRTPAVAEEAAPTPDKKKMKTPAAAEEAAPTPANGKLQSEYFKKVWSSEDELVLVQTLSEFYSKSKRPPSAKDYDSILSLMNGKLSFPVTVKQIINKLRVFKDVYNSWKKKGANISSLNPRSKSIVEISEKFWGDLNNEVYVENENDGTVNGRTEVKSESEYLYLIEAIDELKRDNQNLSKFYKSAFESLDRSTASVYEAKFKKQRLNEAKFCSMKMEMMNKLAKELTKLGG